MMDPIQSVPRMAIPDPVRNPEMGDKSRYPEDSIKQDVNYSSRLAGSDFEA